MYFVHSAITVKLVLPAYFRCSIWNAMVYCDFFLDFCLNFFLSFAAEPYLSHMFLNSKNVGPEIGFLIT